MDCDLHQIIQSKQSLSDMHHKCFAKQMLEGIKAMHDIGVFRKSYLLLTTDHLSFTYTLSLITSTSHSSSCL